jgi:ABC-type hemin transport system ATPase subunit
LRPNSRTQQELKQRLQIAKQARKQAVKRFNEVIRDIPSGLPHPDGSERILNASRELTEAQAAVIALLRDLNQGSLDGDGKKSRA